MKIEKFTIEGKKETIEIEDKIFSSKINLKNSSNVLYKLNSIYDTSTGYKKLFFKMERFSG